MIKLRITYTSRTAHPSSEWAQYGNTNQTFKTVKEAKAFLRDEYFYCKKRVPIYLDTKSRGTIQSGYIYCFKERECSRETGKWVTFYCQHWVSFEECNIRSIDLRTER